MSTLIIRKRKYIKQLTYYKRMMFNVILGYCFIRYLFEVIVAVSGEVRSSSYVFEQFRQFAAIHYVKCVSVFVRFFFLNNFFSRTSKRKINQLTRERDTTTRHHATNIRFGTFDWNTEVQLDTKAAAIYLRHNNKQYCPLVVKSLPHSPVGR